MRYWIACAILAGSWLLPAGAQDEDRLSTRGVLLRRQPGGLTYDIELIRGAERGIVATGYRFRSGDRFAIRVRLTRDAYVYVLNRTYAGEPDELRSTRQIRLVPNPPAAPENRPDATETGSPLAVIYPASGHRLLRAGAVHLLPAADMALEMDEHPGLEQIVLIVSPIPLAHSWLVRRASSAGNGEPRRDAADDAAEMRDLRQMAANAETEEPANASREIMLIPKPGTAPGAAAGKPAGGDKPAASEEAKQAAGSPATASRPIAPEKPFAVEFLLAHFGS